MARDDVLRKTSLEIGQRIRDARARAGLTLSGLTERTGLSEGFLSRLERGQASSSIANLIVIAGALGLEVHELFTDRVPQPEKTRIAVHRRAPGGSFAEVESTGYRWRHLAGGAALDRMEAFHLVFPERNRMDMMVSHPGQEHCYVLSGEIVFHVGGEQHRLGAGDGIFIESEIPHRAENVGAGEAHVLMTVAKSRDEAVGAILPMADWWHPAGTASRPNRTRIRQPTTG